MTKKKYNHPNLFKKKKSYLKKITSIKKKKEWEQKKYLARVMKPRKGNEKRRRK